jgi:DNA-3-methyladenine glycosylase I
MAQPRRCFGDGDPLMEQYHDEEWGTPVYEDRLLFEHLMLDAFQAGLSWRVVLHKRQALRQAFAGFDPQAMARYSARDVERLLVDETIIRNRRKIEAAIHNARGYLEMLEQGGSFGEQLWSFTQGRIWRGPPASSWEALPTTSPQAQAMAADLRQRGFKFVGPTVCYAFMQAVGMVDDHLRGCFRYQPRRRRRAGRDPRRSLP